MFLDPSTEAAEPKPFTGELLSGNAHHLPLITLFAEIDLPKGGLGQELKTKGEIFAVDMKGLPDMLRLKVHQHLPVVKTGFPVITVIPDPALPVRGGGKHGPHPEHFLFLTIIRPHVAAALRAGGGAVGLGGEAQMCAVIAKAPVLHFRDGQVHLVHLNPAATRIKVAFRDQFMNGASGRPFIFIRPCIPFALPFLGPGFLAVNNGSEHHTGFGEGIVGNKPFIGKEVQGLSIAHPGHQRLHGVFLLLEFGQFLIEIFIPGFALLLCPDLAPEGMDLLLQGFALFSLIMQPLHHPVRQAPLGPWPAHDKVLHVLDGILG